MVSACSLYKSQDRKTFESHAKDNLAIQDYKPIQCDEITPLQYWYETRFSSSNSQWVDSLPQLEVWQDTLGQNQIQIRTYENHTENTPTIASVTRCLGTFSSLREWHKFKSFYLKSLEGAQP